MEIPKSLQNLWNEVQADGIVTKSEIKDIKNKANEDGKLGKLESNFINNLQNEFIDKSGDIGLSVTELSFIDTGDRSKVSQEELDWAYEIMNKIMNKGYKATDEEDNKYRDIYDRLNNTNTKETKAEKKEIIDPQTNINNIDYSEQEIKWALQLEQKVKEGYNPTSHEIEVYNSIVDRVKNKEFNNAIQN